MIPESERLVARVRELEAVLAQVAAEPHNGQCAWCLAMTREMGGHFAGCIVAAVLGQAVMGEDDVYAVRGTGGGTPGGPCQTGTRRGGAGEECGV